MKLPKEAKYMAATASPFTKAIVFRSGLGPYRGRRFKILEVKLKFRFRFVITILDTVLNTNIRYNQFYRPSWDDQRGGGVDDGPRCTTKNRKVAEDQHR